MYIFIIFSFVKKQYRNRTVNKVMSQKDKRLLHCSFCDDEGHTINNCQDQQIQYMVKEFNEIIALDMKCKFKMKYLTYVISLYNISEIRVLGYQVNLSIGKKAKKDFVNELLDEYYDTNDIKYSNIIENMNDSELTYFAKKISESSKKWNKRKISENRIKEMLGIEKPEKKVVKVTKKPKENIRFTQIDNDESDTVINYSDTDDSEYSESQIQFYLFPLIDEGLINDLQHDLREILEYFYIVVGAFIIANFYVIISNDY
jgi:hypothetical protein